MITAPILRPGTTDRDMAVEPVRYSDSLLWLLKYAVLAVTVALALASMTGRQMVGVVGVAGTACWLLYLLRGRARRHLVDQAIRGLQRTLGHHRLDRKQIRVHRWTGWWTGSPRRVRVYYSPQVIDDADDPVPGAVNTAPAQSGRLAAPLDPSLSQEWVTEIEDALHRRFGAWYEVVRFNRSRCWLQFRQTPPPSAPEYPDVPPEVPRCEQIVTEILKTAVPIKPTIVERSNDKGESESLVEAFEFDLVPTTTVKLANPYVRDRFRAVMATSLPGQWAVDVDLERDYVSIKRRPELPPMLVHPAPVVTAANQFRLPFGRDESGDAAAWDLRGTGPHMLVSGSTGSGKTSAMFGVIQEAAAREFKVRLCDIKKIEFLGLRGWPNVETVATDVVDIVATIYRAWEEMERRFRLIERGEARESDFVPEILVIDEFADLRAEIDEWWTSVKQRGQPTKCPVYRCFNSLARRGRAAKMHMLVGTQRPDAYILEGEIRAQFTTRLSVGQLDRDGALMMWKSPYVGTAPVSAPGRGVATGGSQVPFDVQVYWTPDPRRMGELTLASAAEEWAVLDGLRPLSITHERMRPVFDPADEDLGPVWDEVVSAGWELDRRPLPDFVKPTDQPISESDVDAPLPPPPPAAPAATLQAVDDGGFDDDMVYPGDVAPGDQVFDESTGCWVTAAGSPDRLDDTLVAIEWSGAAEAQGIFELPADERIVVRRQAEGTAA